MSPCEANKPKTMEIIHHQYRSIEKGLNQLKWKERSLLIGKMMALSLEYLVLLKRCDEKSSIEHWLAIGLLDRIKAEPNSNTLELIPQYPLHAKGHKFRLDFLLKKTVNGFVSQVGIECDGKHHKGVKSALYDHAREEAIRNEHGIYIVRFTGTEIYRDVQRCAAEVMKTLRIVELTQHSTTRKDDHYDHSAIS